MIGSLAKKFLFQTDLDFRSQLQGGRVATFWSNTNQIGIFERNVHKSKTKIIWPKLVFVVRAESAALLESEKKTEYKIADLT